MKYLLDTNTVIYFLGGISLSENALNKIDLICQNGQQLSIITKLELFGYNFTSIESELLTQEFVNKSIVHQINYEIEIETIKLRKTQKIKLPDAIIAATAMVNNLTLISRNVSDFKSITSLKIINPFDW